MKDDHIRLREFIERILEERERILVLTAKNLEYRLDNLNQLRGEVLKDREQFMRVDIYDKMHTALMDRVWALEKAQSRMVGIGITLVVLAGILGAVVEKLFR